MYINTALFFAVNAFVDLIKQFGQNEYDFSLRETQTYEIIEDVAKLRSEIGILYINNFNEAVFKKIFKSYDLEFHELYTARPHVFISRKHPLAECDVISNEQLEDYPYLSFEQENIIHFIFRKRYFQRQQERRT